MTPPTPYLADPDVTLWHGDAVEVLRGMEADSVDCVVCSPPYWSLRDYNVEGQLGLEETPELYVASLVAVFREVRRVLCPRGTCWVNLGDSYNSNESGGMTGSTLTKGGQQTPHNRVGKPRAGLKPKDLVGIPWRVAFALQADGWWLRSDIVWAKPNPMPESVTDRPTKSHEYVFLLTKQPRYFFDAEAVREPNQPDGRRQTTLAVVAVPATHANYANRHGSERWPNPSGRNVRSVWTIATQPYPEAHFATYPEELVRRCVLAGCPERVCRTCGEPSVRQVEKELVATRGNAHPNTRRDPFDASSKPGGIDDYKTVYGHYDVTTTGWSDCGCLSEGEDDDDSAEPRPGLGPHRSPSEKWRPGVVLDPFVGSGTTCLVARDHGRHSVGIDLNADYLALAATRLQQLSLLTGEAHASQ